MFTNFIRRRNTSKKENRSGIWQSFLVEVYFKMSLYCEIDIENWLDQEVYNNSPVQTDLVQTVNYRTLCTEYKKVASEVKELIDSITKDNFKETIYKIIDDEAYLAEIYFYLTSPDLLSTKDLLATIQKEYLLGYSIWLDYQENDGRVRSFVSEALHSKYQEAYKKRFKLNPA